MTHSHEQPLPPNSFGIANYNDDPSVPKEALIDEAAMWFDKLEPGDTTSETYGQYAEQVGRLLRYDIADPVDAERLQQDMTALAVLTPNFARAPGADLSRPARLGARLVELVREEAAREYEAAQLEAYREREKQELYIMATRDKLTGLGNRNALEARVLGFSRNPEAVRTVLAMDIDFFKRVNDILGHAVGDRVLGHVAEYLESALRSEDNAGLYRLGGDEFVVLLPNIEADECDRLLERMRASQLASIQGAEDVRSYDEIWQRICTLFDQHRADPEKHAFEPSIVTVAVEAPITWVGGQVEFQCDKLSVERVLYINGKPIAPLGSLAILSIGCARGPVPHPEAFEKLMKVADRSSAEHKRLNKAHGMTPIDRLDGADRQGSKAKAGKTDER